jgi:alkaline phosphatase D
VGEKTDFSHAFQLSGLTANTQYYYETQTSSPDGKDIHGTVRGKFETAPTAATPSSLSFCVMSCQAYHDRDHHDGHNIYPSMLAQKPKFVVFTGDNVYYDRDEPRAINAGLARYHWERMFSLPRQIELLRSVGSYWEKDDHDTVKDDSWPGVSLGDLTFQQGQEIFRQQVPIGQSPYRTFRWGRDVQVWFTEGRDFRSPNNSKDGAEKSIWGRAQEDWFKQTVSQSDATWKILISPTPLVGPDRVGKNDNHTNRGFQHEGDEIRAWIKEHVPDNFFVVCGDRHWQYHSVHPQSGVVEFSVGAASDAHAGGSPGENPEYHRFHRQKGGFLSVDVQQQDKSSAIAFRLHDVSGVVKYEWKKQRAAAK